ncbi:hypothetical protein GCM10027088_36920 [Nocardia goodfellowii]
MEAFPPDKPPRALHLPRMQSEILELETINHPVRLPNHPSELDKHFPLQLCTLTEQTALRACRKRAESKHRYDYQKRRNEDGHAVGEFIP